jgi:site-specific DNA recombinase
VNTAEAAVVVRIYQMFAGGAGLATIAHALNADGCPAPRAQQGRVSGWCPSSVRAILKRPLYRGELIHGRTKKGRPKRRAGGKKKTTRTRQPESEWVRVSMPHLRIVDEKLAAAVDERFASQKNRALRTRDGRLLGRPPGEGSPYLLGGLLTCAVCGGAMEVASSASGGRRTFAYRCGTRRRKGEAVCTNAMAAGMVETNEAVLNAVERTLLDPRVVHKALAHAERAIARDRNAANVETMEQQLSDCERRFGG